MKAIETSIIIAIIIIFIIVPMPGFWSKKNQKNRTNELTKKVMTPIDKSICKDIPCANTLHGEAPVSEISNKPSPKPNKVNPRHKKRKVEIFGLKFKGFSELHETLGIFLIDKNIFIKLYLQFTWLFFHKILLIFNKNY